MHAKYLGPNKVQVLYDFGTDKWHSYPEGTEIPPGSPLMPKFLSLAEARAMWPDLVVWGGEKPVEATAGVDYEEVDRELATLGVTQKVPHHAAPSANEAIVQQPNLPSVNEQVVRFLEILAAKIEAASGRKQKAYKLQYEHSREMALKCNLVTIEAIARLDAQTGRLQAPVVLS